MRKFQKAFTLAEVLITLGIIGVVAAITIPGLIAEHQKRTTVTKLQRAISVLNQAYKLSFDDVGEPSIEESYNMGAEEYFNTYWAPYIKTAHICKTYKDCGLSSNTPWKTQNGNIVSTNAVAPTARTTFYTLDGFLYVILIGGGGSTPGSYVPIKWLMVDINGSAKPNTVGKDLFYLTRVEDDGAGIQPFGYNFSDTTIKSMCTKSSGKCCAEKIRRGGWKIEKNYPW